jgi:hypothetical protein
MIPCLFLYLYCIFMLLSILIFDYTLYMLLFFIELFSKIIKNVVKNYDSLFNE